MLFHCFLDDSKDQNQSKLLVSAGFLGTKDDWHHLRIAWKKRLKKDGLKYFKTSEYKMLEGEFARFKTAAYPSPNGRNKASQITNDLQDRDIPRQSISARTRGCVVGSRDTRAQANWT